ncbi:MAG TPA: HAMP domain-containing protein [Ktedonobacterales bacterium]|nr:HAMP domain-containing protein [Ktedonobacterales bacterium]
MRRPAYSLLCRIPIRIRLATGFLFAGLVAVLAVGLVSLLPTQPLGQADPLQGRLSAANSELTMALVLLQADESSVHLAIEDAAAGQSHSVLLSDQTMAQGLTTQYEAEIASYTQENLFAQQPAQEEQLRGLGQAEAVEQQRGLVISVTYTWQRYRAAQTQVLQDLLVDQVHAAEMLARFQADPLETDALSALYSLLQFQADLALSVQHAASMQAFHNQQFVTLLAAFLALFLILIAGLLVTISFVHPLHRLRQVTQAVAVGANETRVAVVGHDEVADISLQVNDLLTSIESLLAEVIRQQHGQVSAAEFLVSGASGGDTGAVHAQLAQVGDSLRVLDTVCSDVVARFQGTVSAAQAAAQHLETIALRAQDQAKAALLDSQGASIEFVREIVAAAQEVEALAHALTAPLPGLGETAA